jgi:putative tricarboxylic transport membrane protein
VQSPAWQETLKRMDWNDVFLSGEEFTKFVAAESRRTGGILRDLGLAK